MKNTLLAILSSIALCGCGTITPEQIDRVIDAAENAATNRPPVVVVTNSPPVVVTPPKQSDAGDTSKPNPQVEGYPDVPPAPSSNDFAGITKFRNSADCSKWPVTVQISNARIIGGNIQWDEAPGQREARRWNEKRGKKAINGETIIVIPSRGEAGMFDFLGIGQTRKILSNLKASHEGPGFFAPWQPTKGERIGFCIATISRDKPHANMQERSNVVWLTIP